MPKTLDTFLTDEEKTPMTDTRFRELVDDMEGVFGRPIPNKELAKALDRNVFTVGRYRSGAVDVPSDIAFRLLALRERVTA
jgi:hypothetical protein